LKKLSLNAIFTATVLISAVFWCTSTIAAPKDGIHRLVIHVDDNEPKRMNMALNNAVNVDKYYNSKGEEVIIEIVAYGPGLIMLHADKSPVKERITSFGENYTNISFRACGNTLKTMSKKAGKEVSLLPQAKMVQSGVVHIIQRQEEGWSYVRP
jgi:intracellular sulfur oxidation DsrE/DsrF family protein